MTEHVKSVQADASLDTLVRLLVDGRFGSLPVVNDLDEVLGLVSESDLLEALLKEPDVRTTARDIMSQPPIVVDEFATSDEVMAVLRGSQIHHLPVVREGRLVGIITPHDVLRFFVDHVLPPFPDAG